MVLDLTSFWEQLFSPLNNWIEIFFAILMALLSERIVKEFEGAKIFYLFKNPSNPLDHIANFLFRFAIAFLMVFIIVFLIIFFISLFLGLIGILIAYLFG